MQQTRKLSHTQKEMQRTGHVVTERQEDAKDTRKPKDQEKQHPSTEQCKVVTCGHQKADRCIQQACPQKSAQAKHTTMCCMVVNSSTQIVARVALWSCAIL